MKKLWIKSMVTFFAIGFIALSCKKNFLCPDFQALTQTPTNTIAVKPTYSSLEEFRAGIANVTRLLQSNEVYAYLDTLENGYPDPAGRKASLSEFAYAILEKLAGNDQQVGAAVYDVFHFDGTTFSLISYIMKAQMVNNISAETMKSILDAIPLPPIAMDGFTAPEEPVMSDTPVENCCDHCNPTLQILTTSVYKAPCGNYETTVSGHVAKNKLTHISKGRHYRFDGEIAGCNCPGGKWSNTVEIPGVGSVSSSTSWISIDTFVSGEYTITLSYTVCGKTVTKTFTLSVD